MYIEIRDNAILLKECIYNAKLKRGKTVSKYLSANPDKAIEELQQLITSENDIKRKKELEKICKDIRKKSNDYTQNKALKTLIKLHENLAKNTKISKDIKRIIDKYTATDTSDK